MNQTTEEFAVKARKIGTKRFSFVTSKGHLNPLRIHAARFEKWHAEQVVKDATAYNPNFEFRAVEL